VTRTCSRHRELSAICHVVRKALRNNSETNDLFDSISSCVTHEESQRCLLCACRAKGSNGCALVKLRMDSGTHSFQPSFDLFIRTHLSFLCVYDRHSKQYKGNSHPFIGLSHSLKYYRSVNFIKITNIISTTIFRTIAAPWSSTVSYIRQQAGYAMLLGKDLGNTEEKLDNTLGGE
jgi:hypothetical protein